MATGDQHGPGWTVMLPRQPARIAKGRPEGGYTAAYEIVRCDCGDYPDLDYRAVSPRASVDPGPYPIAAGVAAYAKYLGLDPQPQAACRPG